MGAPVCIPSSLVGNLPSPQVALKHCRDGCASLGPPGGQEKECHFCSSQPFPPLPPTSLQKGLPPRQQVWVSLGPGMRLADTKHPRAGQS